MTPPPALGLKSKLLLVALRHLCPSLPACGPQLVPRAGFPPAGSRTAKRMSRRGHGWDQGNLLGLTTRDTKPGHPAHGREGPGDCTYVYIADTPAERFGITVHPCSAVCATTSTQQRARPSPLGFPGSSVGFLQPAPSRRARGSCCHAERRHQQGKELHPLLNLGPFPAKLGLQRWGASPRSAVLPTSCT